MVTLAEKPFCFIQHDSFHGDGWRKTGKTSVSSSLLLFFSESSSVRPFANLSFPKVLFPC